MNSIPIETKLEDLTPTEFPRLFSRAQAASSFINWRYQYGQNLFADLYSQYFYITNGYLHKRPVYLFRRRPRDTMESYIYGGCTSIEDLAGLKQTRPLLKMRWQRYGGYGPSTGHTDYYGPIPYFSAGDPGESVPYDSQEDMYNDFFVKLTEAEAVLKANTGKTPYGEFDLVYQGDVSKWIKFANTLRLRLALRISKVNPGKAKTEAEAAFAAGVMTDISDDALMAKIPPVGDDYGGLSSIAVWNEFRMSASMESVLKGYNDPRMGIYFQKADSTNDYDGGRNGMRASELIISDQ